MKIKLFLFFLILIGFFYRLYGLGENYSFWTDENHTAIFVRAILERGKPVLANGYSTGVYQWLQYWLGAISAKVFGLNEFAIRFPPVVFGVLTIWAVYLLGREVYEREIGVVAAVLITFSKIEILWSRQARPYQALQFFYVLGAWFLYRGYRDDKGDRSDRGNLLGFLGCGVAASLMHPLGLVILGVGVIYLLVGGTLNQNKFGSGQVLGKWGMIGVMGVLGYVFRIPLLGLLGSLGKVNNLFYYRVFLWHNYSLLVFLGVVGVLRQAWILPALFLATQGLIASFLLGQPFTRYFYPVFPFLVLLAAAGLGVIAECLGGVFRQWRGFLLLFLTFFIIGMGNKFTLFPRKIYSLNEDMQEIPEVDWKKIYGFVGEKLEENPEAVLVTNWNDLPVWYLGEGKPDYLIRKPWPSAPNVDPVSGAKLVLFLEEFKQRVVEGSKKGIFIVDSWDDRVPDGTREYCRENLKKELEVDRLYPVQPRLWPVEVYSWGM